MHPSQPDVATVLGRYPAPYRAESATFLGGAGGFSGSRLWRLASRQGELCLRRWPAGYPLDQLRFVHAVLAHAHRAGFQELAVPISASSRATWVEHEGVLWELTAWLPGQADADEPVPAARLRAAMQALARFHLAVESWRSTSAHAQPSPGIVHRLELLESWSDERLNELCRAAAEGDWPELAARTRPLCAFVQLHRAALLAELRDAARLPVRLRPAIRDIWREHVLFDGDRVSGLVDFGSMKLETVSGDIARLVGSLVGADAAAWHIALDSYQAVRPLDEIERSLVGTFDRANVLLSGLNWPRWHFIDGRRFDDRQRVLTRVDHFLKVAGAFRVP